MISAYYLAYLEEVEAYCMNYVCVFEHNWIEKRILDTNAGSTVLATKCVINCGVAKNEQYINID
jgi:hypothetical protein